MAWGVEKVDVQNVCPLPSLSWHGSDILSWKYSTPSIGQPGKKDWSKLTSLMQTIRTLYTHDAPTSRFTSTPGVQNFALQNRSS
jgi:hypothetical protein